MPSVPRELAEHHLHVRPEAKPVKQPLRRFAEERRKAIGEEIVRLLAAGFIMEVLHPDWLANPVLVLKKTGSWRMCIDYTSLNKACPKDPSPAAHKSIDHAPHPLHRIQRGEYEALIHGLKLAKEIGVRCILCFGDSDLVIQQASGDWDAKDANMASYRFHVQQLADFFEGCEFHHVPRANNEAADALSKIGSTRQAIPPGVALQHLRKPSITPSPDSDSIFVSADPGAPQPNPGTSQQSRGFSAKSAAHSRTRGLQPNPGLIIPSRGLSPKPAGS
ncbi:hypothetical protein QYE76_045900 [Lolium multiflorum]|uniref:RNase H type-1 domain-containing protein n=1 Tax=Lolium multiflorum TaxID=4521 RepID=A0AAD8WXW0_LOLMU|nr:hypothetical protein QYE76_045900 [Lolium multiflorum]